MTTTREETLEEVVARDGYAAIWSYLPHALGDLLLPGKTIWNCDEAKTFGSLPWKVVADSSVEEHFAQCGVVIDPTGLHFYRIEVAD